MIFTSKMMIVLKHQVSVLEAWKPKFENIKNCPTVKSSLNFYKLMISINFVSWIEFQIGRPNQPQQPGRGI